MPRKLTVISLLGPTLDAGDGAKRWKRWRPNVAICQQPSLPIHRLELLHQKRFSLLAERVRSDIQSVSPDTEVCLREIEVADPWDLEEVYGMLYEFARNYSFRPEKEDYLLHITTGTHIAQICIYLLTEARYFPAKLLQASPPNRKNPEGAGSVAIIDLDLSKYDRIASRFVQETQESLSFLKGGIETRNLAFNSLIERIEKVATLSSEPMLLMGPTGAGKSRLAEKIYELKKNRHQIQGGFVAVNCATIRGDGAMSTLFGHVRGSFTGSVGDRPGLLKAAHKGLLFLDEIGELGLDEQAMLLRALEEKTFLPVGSDKTISSDFQLIAGTNRDLRERAGRGEFREDLLARINLWSFKLPGLNQRREDIEPNIQYELERYSSRHSSQVSFNKEARERFLRFATSPAASWPGNFRELNGTVIRMATLASGGRITTDIVNEEIQRLHEEWSPIDAVNPFHQLESLLNRKQSEALDLFDRLQLAQVIQICRDCKSLSEAGRRLFNSSRVTKSSHNDADRLRKYLARFDLSWDQIRLHP